MTFRSIASICAFCGVRSRLLAGAAGRRANRRAVGDRARWAWRRRSGPALIGFPARTDTVDFRTQLENKYVSMGRRPSQTIVDMEGEATWVGDILSLSRERLRSRHGHAARVGAGRRSSTGTGVFDPAIP